MMNSATRFAGEQTMALKFGVKKVGDEGGEGSPPDDSQIEFFCPGCGKAFQQSARAAGKKTKCPQCEIAFLIPETLPAPAPPKVQESSAKPPKAEAPAPPPPEDTEAAIAAAVAAYNAGKPTSPRGAPRWIVPTGLALLLLGGILSITGSWLMVRGYWKAFGLEELLGGKGADISSIIGGVFGGRNEIMQNLLADIDNPNRRPRPRQPAQQNSVPEAKKLLAKVDEQQKGLQEQLEERKTKRNEGQSMVLWGVVTHGAGKLATFIGGIFLLAGLIGKYLSHNAAEVKSRE